MLSQAQLLDELMGRDRNLAPQEKKCSLHWSDPSICKMYLSGFCPHDLFTNTRSDLGFCEKVHDDKLRDEYKSSRRFGTMGYEEDFQRYLQTLLSDVDRRIRRGHSRLTTTQELMKEKQLGKLNTDSEREKEAQLSEKVTSLVEQAEKLGCDGKVEEAQGVMKLVDQLKEERDLLTSKVKDPSFNGQEKLMEVCEVCGAFLIIGDAQIRVDDHLQGKQHKGYAQIKAAAEELKDRPWLKKPAPIKREEGTDKEKTSISENKEARSGDKEARSGDKDRRSGDKDRRSDDKDRRSSDKDRDRRRDRDRDRRDRGHDRRDRDRDRDRRRDRDRDHDRRRDRSRSRDRKRSSRDDDRSHSRDKDDSRRDKDDTRRDKDDSRRDKDDSRRDKDDSRRETDDNRRRDESKEEKDDEKGNERQDVLKDEKMVTDATEEIQSTKGSQDDTSAPEKTTEEM